MDLAFLSQYNLPDEALDQIKKLNLHAVQIENGVNRFLAHDRGVAYRFFIHTEYNKKKSDESKKNGKPIEIYDEIPMVEWFKDKFCKVPERIRFLPKELLFINEDGEAFGSMAEAYKRWKAGLTAPGLALNKWGVLSDASCATLAAAGIFSVEGFAASPRSKIEGRFPEDIVEAFERAIQYVNGKEYLNQAQEREVELKKLEEANKKLSLEMAEMRKEMKGLLSPKKSPGRPKKEKEVIPTEEEIL